MKKLIHLSNLFLFIFKNNIYFSALAIFTLMLSQVLLLVSYFLPIKVLVLLTRDNISDSLSSIFFNLGREEVILLLTVLVFIAYASYVLLEKYSNLLVKNIVVKLTGQKENKFVLKFIDNFIKVSATMNFVLLLYCIVLYLFPLIGIAMLIYAIIFYIVLHKVKINRQKYNDFFKLSSGLGFMLIFTLEMVSALYFKSENTSVTKIVIVLVLARYIFTRSISILNKLLYLYSSSNNFYEKIKR